MAELESFVELVWQRGGELYRDLPWRNTRDPYEVLVSEVMLQQTQVNRVIKYWERFLRAFPTIDALASASASDVLEMWQGLGYNRRALALKRMADMCSQSWAGQLPDTYEELIALPGIGPATAAGVMAFAYGKPGVYLETNVRAVFIHEFFPEADKVSDRQLEPLVRAACPDEDAPFERGVRAWYYALLDYGAYLKQVGVNPTRRSSHYTRQSAFEGSRRQKRAWIVRRVLAEPEGVKVSAVHRDLNHDEVRAGRNCVDRVLFDSIVDDLVREGFFKCEDELLLPNT